jgi:hypothetical protein
MSKEGNQESSHHGKATLTSLLVDRPPLGVYVSLDPPARGRPRDLDCVRTAGRRGTPFLPAAVAGALVLWR